MTVGLVALLLFSAVGAVEAQQVTAPTPSAPLDAPPAPAPDPRGFTLGGAVLLDGSHTDNFFRSSSNRQSEYRETLTPSIDVRLRASRGELRFLYAPTVVHSSLNDEDLRLFHLLDAAGSLQLTDRFTLTLTDNFLKNDEPTLTDPSGVARDRTVLTRELFTAALLYRQDRWSLTPRYAFTFTKNDVDETESGATATTTTTTGVTTVGEESVLQTFGLDGTRELDSRTALGLTYEYTTADFQVAQDFTSHLGALTLTRELSRRLTGKVDGSVLARRFADDTVFMIYRGGAGAQWTPRDGWGVSGRLGYVYGDFSQSVEDDVEYFVAGTYTGANVRLSLSAAQLLRDTSGETVNAGFVKAREYGLRITVQPADRLSVVLGARYLENTFTQSGGSTIASSTTSVVGERRDHLTEIGLEATYRLTRMLSLISGYTYTHNDSNQAGLSYTSNRVHLGVLLTFE